MSAEKSAEKIIQSYYEAFNSGNPEGMLALLSDDVVHDINQGTREKGKEVFRKFMGKMDAHYKERLEDIVIMASKDNKRAAAEFTVVGKYLKTDPGLPEARGQEYRIPAGTFFELKNGKISRVTTYYNLNDWIAKVQ